jgi:hypothetical protein
MITTTVNKNISLFLNLKTVELKASRFFYEKETIRMLCHPEQFGVSRTGRLNTGTDEG